MSFGAGASVSYWLLAVGCPPHGHLPGVVHSTVACFTQSQQRRMYSKMEDSLLWHSHERDSQHPVPQCSVDEKQVTVPAHTNRHRDDWTPSRSLSATLVQHLVMLLTLCGYRQMSKLVNHVCLKCAIVAYCHSCKKFTNKNRLAGHR